MSFDQHANFVFGIVKTAPTPADTGVSLILEDDYITNFPDPVDGEYDCTVCSPSVQYPTKSNSEIVRVTVKVGGLITITRHQRATTAISIQPGDIIFSGVYADHLKDIESALNSHQTNISNPHSVTKSQVGLPNVTNDSQVKRSEMAVANGVATLGSDGKIPSNQLNPLAITSVFTASSQVSQLALTSEEGDVCVRTDLSKSYVKNSGTAGTMADWTELLTPTDTVVSVNGYTGSVSLTKSDIGLGNVDNLQQLPLSYLDIDNTLVGNSDAKVSSQKAVKTYIDTGLSTKSPTSHNHSGTYEPVLTKGNLSGTASQISVSGGTGAVIGSGVTLSLPQNIDSTAIPTFAGLVLPYIKPAANSTTAFQIRKADGTTSVLNVDTTNGYVGIGTTSPTNILSLGGNSVRKVWMERHTTANTAGNSLTLEAGGATVGATDKNGGDLIIKSGLATGTGFSSIKLQAPTAGFTGTADATFATLIELGNNKLGFFGVTAVVRPTAMTAAGTYTLNTGDAGSDTEITLMRTRINELETKLKALGLLT